MQSQATMKRYCRLLTIILGGVLLMMSLSACGQKETTPANRTKEQYELEKEFQPLFDFLAEEKKDLSKVEVYGSFFILSNPNGDNSSNYGVTLSGGKNQALEAYTGKYAIETPAGKEDYPITYQNQTLHYATEVSPEYDMDIFNISIKPEFFKRFPISDYMAKHPEAYMKTITYEVDSSDDFLALIRKKYDLEQSKVTLRVVIDDYTSYTVYIFVENEKNTLMVGNSITIKGDNK